MLGGNLSQLLTWYMVSGRNWISNILYFCMSKLKIFFNDHIIKTNIEKVVKFRQHLFLITVLIFCYNSENNHHRAFILSTAIYTSIFKDEIIFKIWRNLKLFIDIMLYFLNCIIFDKIYFFGKKTKKLIKRLFVIFR